MKKRLASHKGLTMIELVVAFALSAMFFAALLTVIAPVYRTYQRTRDFADAELIAGNVIDAIRTTASNAQTLTAGGDSVSVGTRLTYSVSDQGHLQYTVTDNGETETKDVFDKKVYDGKTITLTSRELGTNVIDITVSVATRHGTSATISGVISTVFRYVSSGSSGPVIPPDPRTHRIPRTHRGRTTRIRRIIRVKAVHRLPERMRALLNKRRRISYKTLWSRVGHQKQSSMRIGRPIPISLGRRIFANC